MEDFFLIAHIHQLGGVDVPFGAYKVINDFNISDIWWNMPDS